MSFRIIDIDPNNFPEALLNKYVEFSQKVHVEQSPRDPLPSNETFLKRMRGQNLGKIHILKAVLSEKDKDIIARLHMRYFTEESFKFEEKKHILDIDFDVLKEYKVVEVAKDLLKKAFEKIKQNKLITQIDTCSTYQRIWEFWEKLGAEITEEEGVNRLYIDDVNWDLMEEWVKEGRNKAQEENIELLAFKECPEEIIEDFTALVTKIMNLLLLANITWTPSVQTPESYREGEKSQKEIGFDWRVLVTKEKDGILSGLTEIIFSPDTTRWVVQDLTGVLLKYRGRGIGKWMKAENQYYIKENLPETVFIQTMNADFNAPMMSINNRMGFKLHQTKKCYKIKVEDLERYLNSF